MSEITQNFVVEPNNINITVDNNNINFTPNTNQLSIYAVAAPVGGSNTQLQYNNNGTLGGIANVTWNGSKLSLGNVANVRMTGGTNGYVLQTDGVGNLSWTAQTGGGGGNGTPGGANTQIQYNDSGSFGGNAGFTFDEITGNVNMPANLNVIGNIFGSFNANYANFAGEAFNALVSGTVYTNAQPNITSLGTLTSVSVSGNANIGNIGTTSFTATGNGTFGNISASGNVSVTGNVTAANFIGNVTGNISGHANTANTVTNNAQPNITSLGTLTSVSVSGNANIGNIGTGGLITATGNITSSSNISATGNVTANRANIETTIVAGGAANGSVIVRSPALGSIIQLTGFDGAIRGSFVSVGEVFSTPLYGGSGNISFGGTLKNDALYANASIALTSGNIRTTSGNVQGNRLVSTVATGHAPIVVTSTTLVANLNVANAAYAANAGTLAAGATVGNLYSSANSFLQPGANYYIGFAGARVQFVYANNANVSNLQLNTTASAAVSTTVTHKVPISINGVTYYMCLTSTP